MKNYYKDFLLRLKEERIRCGLIQRQLCSHAKTGQSSFSKAETGRIRFTWAKLKYFCTTGMDVFYVFTGNKAADWLRFLELSTTAPEELLWLLNAYLSMLPPHEPKAGPFPGHSLICVSKLPAKLPWNKSGNSWNISGIYPKALKQIKISFTVCGIIMRIPKGKWLICWE